MSAEARIALRPGLRLTAADRPGQAQPVPERDIPERDWGTILLAALVMTLLMLGMWEWHWRAFGVEPSLTNSDALWATQRRRIDHGEGNGATVLIGSSRMLFDLQLPVWQKLSGKRPIQRHQIVYAALGDRMREEIHALSMKTLTPDEYQG